VKRPRVLYIFHKSLTETIPRLHGLAQVRALSSRRPFVVVSFEPAAGRRAEEEMALYGEVRSWLRDAGIRHVGLPALGTRWLELPLGALAVLWLTVFLRVRIIHARSYIPALMALPVSLMTGARLLFDMRGLFVDEYLHDGALREGTFKLSVVRGLERWLLARSHAIVVVSEAFRGHLLARPDLRGVVSAERIHIIPNRVDLSRFAAALAGREEERRVRGWEGSVVAVFTGSVAGWHRLDRTMEVMRDVMARLPSSRLVVAVYPDTAEAERIADRTGVPPERLEIATLPVEAIPRLLAAADLGLMFIESHVSKLVCAPIKFSEYMAAGLPAIASPGVGDTGAWIGRERLGIVVDHDAPSEAASRIVELVTSPDFVRGHARERCLRFAERELNMKDTLTQYESLYEELE
jgi:glycosyltransferase involved in cell wall biosynthesis